MDRYQIAVHRNKRRPITPVAYVFKPTASSLRVYEYMQKCVEDEKMLDCSNLKIDLVDTACVRLAKAYGLPIIAGEKSAHILSIVQNYRKVYTMESLPSKYTGAIIYWDAVIPDPKLVNSLLIIRKQV